MRSALPLATIGTQEGGIGGWKKDKKGVGMLEDFPYKGGSGGCKTSFRRNIM